MAESSEVRVRPTGSNAVQLSPPEKLRFYVCPHATASVEKEFPAATTLEASGFAPAMHREAVELLMATGLRPPGAGLLVIRLFPGSAPKDDTIVIGIRDEDGEPIECGTLKVGQHSHPANADGTVDFAVWLIFGDPEDLPSGKVAEGLCVVDVSTIESEGAPARISIGGGSWGVVELPVQEFNLEVERF